MSANKIRKALTFSVSGALLAGTLASGCETPARTSNPGPEPEATVNEGPAPDPIPTADAGVQADVAQTPPVLEKPIIINPGPETPPEPTPEGQ